MKECKVIAIANEKGGVGKTTTTAQLGIGLVRDGYKVLLIDADPQGSLTISLGVTRPDEIDISLATLMRFAMEDRDMPEVPGIMTHPEGVDFIPSNIELSGIETSLVNIMSREFVLGDIVQSLKPAYDYILIDCMPSLGMMTINAMACADSLIIPTQPSYLSAKGLNLLLGTVAKVKKNINPDLEIDGILFTMVDSRTNNAKDIIAALKKKLGDNLRFFDSMIPRSVRAAECSISGKSIYSFDRNSKLAAVYEQFTEEVKNLEERTNDRSWDDWVR